MCQRIQDNLVHLVSRRFVGEFFSHRQWNRTQICSPVISRLCHGLILQQQYQLEEHESRPHCSNNSDLLYEFKCAVALDNRGRSVPTLILCDFQMFHFSNGVRILKQELTSLKFKPSYTHLIGNRHTLNSRLL